MGIFKDDGPVDSKGCPTVPGEETAYKHGTSHNVMLYITAACAAVSLLLGLSLIFTHLRRYRVPKEQRQIVKIILSPPVFAIVAFGSVQNYHVAPYTDELGEWYSAVVFTTLFLLFIEFAVPDSNFGDGMFTAMAEVAQQEGKGQAGGWPKLSWLLVFQYPLTETLAIIILEGTTASGTYCSTSLKPKFGHLWFQIIKTVGLVLCFMTVLRFYGKIKRILKARRGAAKLFMFKGIVGIRFLQTWIFQILVDRKAIEPSSHFSLGDLTYGIPNVLLAAEMVLFSAGFWYAYSSTEYSTKARPSHEQLSFFRALLDAISPADIVLGILRIPSILSSGGVGRSAGSYTGPKYGPVDGRSHHQQNYSLDSNDMSRPPFAYDQTTYQPPPPFHPRDEEEAGAKQHLFADPRNARSPSPRRY